MKSVSAVKAVGWMAGWLMCAAGGTQAADQERGQALHDTFCVMCHAPSVYTRPERLANTYLEVRQQVERWQGNARLRWSRSDIDAVTEYIVDRFYKVPR